MMTRRATPIPTPAQAAEFSPVECPDVDCVPGTVVVEFVVVEGADTDIEVVTTETDGEVDEEVEVEADDVIVELKELEFVVTAVSASVILK